MTYIPDHLMTNLIHSVCAFTDEEFNILGSFVTSRIRSRHLHPFISSSEEIRNYLNQKPNEKSLPCIEGSTVQGTINESGDWEPMISMPVSEYEELREKAAMYDDLCK